MIEPVHDPVFVNAVAAPAVCGPMPRMDAPTSDWTLDELYDARLRRSLTAMEKTLTRRLRESSALTNTRGLRACIARIRCMLAELDHACAALDKRQTRLAGTRRTKPQ